MLQPTQLQRLKAAAARAETIFKILERMDEIPNPVQFGELTFDMTKRGERESLLGASDLGIVITLGMEMYQQRLHTELEAMDKEFFSKVSEPEDNPTDDDLEEPADQEDKELFMACSNLQLALDTPALGEGGWEQIVRNVKEILWPAVWAELRKWHSYE